MRQETRLRSEEVAIQAQTAVNRIVGQQISLIKVPMTALARRVKALKKGQSVEIVKIRTV